MPTRRLLAILVTLTAIFSHFAIAEDITVSSPNGRIVVNLSTNGAGIPRYRIDFNGKAVIRDSQLGLEYRELPNMTEGVSIRELARSSADNEWQQPWGERRDVRDHYNELLIALERTALPAQQLNLRFRVFNDGVGFRYEMPAQGDLGAVDVVGELTEFGFVDQRDVTALYIRGEDRDRYETLYESVPYEAIHTAATPITFKRPDGIVVSLHEAALVDWAGYTLISHSNPKTLRTRLAPWSDGTAVKTAVPFKSSWRTVQIADSDVGLLNSDLILNLNEPNKLGDVSWFKPGKYTGIWWEMHRQEYTWGASDKHGATNERVKGRIDFAADYGFDGVLVEGWNVGWDGDWWSNGGVDFSFTETYPDFDMPMLSTYAAERGVRIIGHHETSGNVALYNATLDEALDYYTKYDVNLIKTGYVAWSKGLRRLDDKGFPRYEWHDGQWAAQEYIRVVLEAAERKISINTHESIKDTGLRRTYPNWVSRESARGMEYSSVGAADGVNPPDHDLNLVFTRMLSGPMDYTPGIFDLTYRDLETPARVKSTLAHQLALYVVLYSPIQMVPDYREHYERYPDAFQFVLDVPTDWEESIALDGAIGDYVAYARQERDSKDWYVGAISGNNAHDTKLSLNFLEQGASYTAQIYRDGEKAHWENTPFDYIVETREVTSADTLNLRLAAGGGFAIRLHEH